jgi:hypothetical protein
VSCWRGGRQRWNRLGRRDHQVRLGQALEGSRRPHGGGAGRALDVADAAAWWASDWSHGERAVLELLREPALAADRPATFHAIERCREGDGALRWRPAVIVAHTRR